MQSGHPERTVYQCSIERRQFRFDCSVAIRLLVQRLFRFHVPDKMTNAFHVFLCYRTPLMPGEPFELAEFLIGSMLHAFEVMVENPLHFFTALHEGRI